MISSVPCTIKRTWARETPSHHDRTEEIVVDCFTSNGELWVGGLYEETIALRVPVDSLLIMLAAFGAAEDGA